MPELPEVEHGRQVAEKSAQGRVISRAICADDSIVYDGVTPRRFRSTIVGREVESVERHGKHLWFVLDHPPHPVFHFGMTGSFRVPDEVPLQLEADGRKLDTTWPPRFVKLHLFFEDGGELAFVNKRRLGRIRLLEDPLEEPPIATLGFDPLLDLPPSRRFRDLLGRRSGTLKGLLLDQSFAAGVGNWIADEVLYQSSLDPRRRVGSLTEAEVQRLRNKLGHVIRRAVKVNADKSRFPKTWLFHYRWGKNEDARDARGEKIHHIQVAGRTTAWVPSVQS